MFLPVLVVILFFLYSLLLFYYWSGWRSIPVEQFNDDLTPVTRVSVIIAARNEEDYIGRLLHSLKNQSYPTHLLEVIVVDDHSTDRTATIVGGFPEVKLITLDCDPLNSYKKKAVETGISVCKGDLIVTTDADCYCGPHWLRNMVAKYERDRPVFLAAPVVIDCDSSLLQVFQAFDFAILQGITGASVHRKVHAMSNGANQAYQRSAFTEVGGFAGIDHIASGDDMLLMHKIEKRFPGKMEYLKSEEAIVHTAPVLTWQAFFRQRIRWASKATHYTDKRIFAVLLLVYLFNLLFPLMAIAGIWNYTWWWWLLALWIGKTFIELPFVYSVTGFFGKRFLTRYLFLLQPLHIIYTIVSGFLGQLGKYEWKGRSVK